MKQINRKSAEHYNWKEVCDGWHFINTDALSVIAERMPPHTQEDMHLHHLSRQFFYILSGRAEMRLQDKTVELSAGDGIEIEPMEVHQMRNVSDHDVEFMVISSPKSHGDRELVPFRNDAIEA